MKTGQKGGILSLLSFPANADSNRQMGDTPRIHFCVWVYACASRRRQKGATAPPPPEEWPWHQEQRGTSKEGVDTPAPKVQVSFSHSHQAVQPRNAFFFFSLSEQRRIVPWEEGNTYCKTTPKPFLGKDSGLCMDIHQRESVTPGKGVE